MTDPTTTEALACSCPASAITPGAQEHGHIAPCPLAAPPVTGLEQQPLLELVERATVIDGRMLALAAAKEDVRAELTRRARAFKAEQGMAPTWRSPYGTVLLTDPQPTVSVDDPQALAEWVAQRTPEHVAATITLTLQSPTAERLEFLCDVLDALCDDVNASKTDATAMTRTTPVLTPDPKAQAELVKSLTVTEDGAIGPGGELVPGVVLVPARTGHLQVKLDPQAKARAAAEAVDPSALAVLTSAIGHLPTTNKPPSEVVIAGKWPDRDAGVQVVNYVDTRSTTDPIAHPDGHADVVQTQSTDAVYVGPQNRAVIMDDALPVLTVSRPYDAARDEPVLATVRGILADQLRGADLNGLTIAQLKDHLHNLGARVGGTKPVLVQRLHDVVHGTVTA